jgi:class 3 adenylate cyclase/tetratricopeptide (TPR) repeat protein
MTTEPSQVACPSCRHANPADLAYCERCGARLSQVCASCGSFASGGAQYCGQCGASLPRSGGEAVPVEERKIVTVLYADLIASTELASRLDPEDLRQVLKPFFDAMAEEIERFGGTVEKFIGDAIVAAFGVPAAHEDDPERAVRAAFAMQRRLASLSVQLPVDSSTELKMRIAVNTGEVFAASPTFREGLVTGEAVSIAARLQTVARPGGIVVAERTYRDTRSVMEYSELPAATLKGIGHPLRLWEALGERPPRGGQPFGMPLVGRTGELELLHQMLRRTVRLKRATVVTIVGPPGIGKSRLSHEFIKAIREEQAAIRIVRGRCPPYGDGLTYWPLAEILKADADILDSDRPDVMAVKARARLRSRLASEERVAEIAPVLLSTIGHAVDPDPLLDVSAEMAKTLVFRSWRAYFESLASERAVVVVLEDLHWGDRSLLELIENLATNLAGSTLLLCTARPDVWERYPTWSREIPDATTIELLPLSDRESGALIHDLLGKARSPDAAIGPVIDRAEGNPFFTLELVRMLIEDGVLARGGDGWELVREMPAALPDTVHGVIAARIDRLQPSEKRAIQEAAVVGRVFWQGALQHLGTSDPRSAVNALIEKALVVERGQSTIDGERELMFAHVLTRDVAYASLPRARRPTSHRRAGEWIENVTKGRAEEFAEILAHHFDTAHDHARTARYALLAGLRKRRLFAAEDAIRWYDRALAAADRAEERDPALIAEIGLARGAAREQLARFSEAEQDYDRAAALARAVRDRRLEARALTALAHVYWLEDRYEDGRRVLEDALDRSGSVGARDLQSRLLYTAGTFAFGRGEWDEALAYQRLALEAAPDAEAEAFARHGLVDACALKGAFQEGLAHAERASDLARRLGLRPLLYENEFMRGLMLLVVGQQAEAATAFDEAVKGTEELGDRRNLGPALVNRSRLKLVRGDLGGALRDCEAAMSAIASVESPRIELTCSTFLMEALAHVGMFDRLEALVGRGVALLNEIGGVYWRSRLYAFEGWLALRSGHIEAAETLFMRARELARFSLLDTMICAQVQLFAWEEMARPEPLREAAEMLRRAAHRQSPSFAAWGDYGVALSATLAGDLEAARTKVEGALAQAVAVGEELLVWRTLALSARVLDALGLEHEAAARRAEATKKLERIASTIEDPALGVEFFGHHPVMSARVPWQPRVET